MEKTIEVDGKQLTLKSHGATPILYKNQFKRDYLADIVRLMKTFGAMNVEDMANLTEEQIAEIDTSVVFDMAWIYAKAADKSIPDPMAWLSSFEEFPIMDITIHVADMAVASLKSKKK